ncbi:hypothetical protein EMIHUDRAFT_422967 [Emiliania huxleyi CCMP1516]|uniref:Uncharacterized protein n=2 Tax=Emiliania huxleyi TaxID=2903 RepID=A0A0D3KX95_EMIH1|nr:hypothetical protein EMIHUDRAFT_422967 [Emiliania huxleyi CCMP1516]EOD40380.1 hypothetical protein EMIHUDRAFT_422967 [Emiliania huxleyi CCMP1516]|mmetsp:Transcript_22714/g.64686  ORF Transcript_22714/g.64686 Transcript_22714/m.64686 type:complete len:559 (-) Transcript_22714:185-1861(-)|eukprot:XP_005792809.1 hypothetical protein EMIHUDRAFT_422967 [Emiliania huxleyi CCMP1516]
MTHVVRMSSMPTKLGKSEQAGNLSRYLFAASKLYPPRGMQRGVSIAETLMRWRSVFHTNPDRMTLSDREQLFERSEVVGSLDAFVSHSWKSRGRYKWAALVFHELGIVPLVAAIVACLMMAWQSAAFHIACDSNGNPIINLPVLRETMVAGLPTVTVASPWEYVLGISVALSSAVFLLAMQRRRYYFVDAACIPQTDRAQKVQAIRHLAGFVALSQRLLVLWDEHYFTRLWCVYELAVFQAVHPNRPVIFLPLQCAAASFVMLGLIFLGINLFAIGWVVVVHVTMPWSSVYSLFVMPPTVWAVHFFGQVAAAFWGASAVFQRILLQQTLDSFDVRQAGCSCATDREEIYAAIEGMHMHHGGGGLDAFNRMVRTTLKDQVLQRLYGPQGQSTVKYSTLLMVLLPVTCFVLGQMFTAIRESPAFVQGACLTLFITTTLCTIPYLYLNGIDRGARLARESSQPGCNTLRAFESRARLAIVWTAVRGATEVTLAVSACISMYAAAEWPEAFGLSPRSPCVWVVVSLWNAAWGLVAYRAFGVGSRAAATPDGALVGANESSAS